MKFITASGSTYEVDLENKMIRRLNGQADPTPRQGKDGQWKEYINHPVIRVGYPVSIEWADAHPPTEETKAAYHLFGMEAPPPYKGSHTITSEVVDIEESFYPILVTIKK